MSITISVRGRVYRLADPFDRFVSKVEFAANGCWLWCGARQPSGYGRFSVGSRAAGTYRLALTHRWSYEYFVGPIAEGLQLDHLCRNPRCVNPGHLEPVTGQVNLLRGDTFQAKNAAKTHCPRGHEYDVVRKDGSRDCRQCAATKARARYRRLNPNSALPPGQRTHCPQGHEYDRATERVRYCRTCKNETQRRYLARKAAAA